MSSQGNQHEHGDMEDIQRPFTTKKGLQHPLRPHSLTLQIQTDHLYTVHVTQMICGYRRHHVPKCWFISLKINCIRVYMVTSFSLSSSTSKRYSLCCQDFMSHLILFRWILSCTSTHKCTFQQTNPQSKNIKSYKTHINMLRVENFLSQCLKVSS